MKNTSKKLTIAIATYNRADYIGKTIENIQSQLTDEVELLSPSFINLKEDKVNYQFF